MRRGCISLGEILCDSCHETIHHSERYLAIEEVDGVEADKGQTARYCMDCAQKKDYAHFIQEKDGKVLSIFPSARGLVQAL